LFLSLAKVYVFANFKEICVSVEVKGNFAKVNAITKNTGYLSIYIHLKPTDLSFQKLYNNNPKNKFIKNYRAEKPNICIG
jgi:hypothetical protein